MKHKAMYSVLDFCLCLLCASCRPDIDIVAMDTENGNPTSPETGEELISYTHAVPDGYDREADKRGSIVRIDYSTRDYAEEGIEASRDHRAIGGFSMGAVTTWYAFDETLSAFRYFMPISGDCWSLGRFAGMNRPDETAAYLAERVLQSPYAGTGFYIWAASGTNDSAYSEILLQIEGMARLTDVFNTTNMTFHQKEGARHEFRPIPEYLYNALPILFPKTDKQQTVSN